jgi:hypothetical protein
MVLERGSVVNVGLAETEPIPMERGLVDILLRYREQMPRPEEAALLFPGTLGKPLTARWAQRIVKRTGQKVELPDVTCNDLRWFGIERLRKRIKDDLRIRRMLGLKSTAFLDHMDDALRVRRYYRKDRTSSAGGARKKGGRPDESERNAILRSWFWEFRDQDIGAQAAYDLCADRWNEDHPPKNRRPLSAEAVRKVIRPPKSKV